MFENNEEDIIEFLESKGALILDGVASNGEAVFKFNLDILKEVLPPLYNDIMAELDEDLLTLYKEGLVDVEYDEELNARFKISEKGERVMKDLGNLPPFLN
jgi:hypothetical protein